MNGANVYSVMLGASKYALNNRLLSRARSIEVCTEQPFTQSCSEHREYAWINRFSIMYGRTLVNFLSLFCFLFQLQECALVPFYGIPSMLETFCFHRHGACLEARTGWLIRTCSELPFQSTGSMAAPNI